MELSDLLREQTRVKPKANAVLDSCGGKKENPVLDGASDYATNDIKLKAVAMVQQWTETDDLDDGESYADRLIHMVIGIADANKDGEIDEDEQAVVDVALNAIWDYLANYGVDDADIDALLNNWDNDAAERVKDLLAASLPEGDDADADIDNFVFNGEDQGAVFDAAYKKVFAVRGGKKVRINKRISGAVKLSARQKVAIRKAQMKSHSAGAQMRRVKSMKVRSKMGI